MALIGFTAVIGQVVLLRELMVISGGNEISLGMTLAFWLLWTAVGSGVCGLFAARIRRPRLLLASLEIVVGVALPASIVAVRGSRVLLGAIPGETLGPGAIALTSAVALAVFCVASGALFFAASRAFSGETMAENPAGTVYLLEAIGSGLGGLIASVVLIRFVDTLQIAALLLLFNLATALALTVRRRRGVAIIALVVTAAMLPFISTRIERVSDAWSWRGFNVLGTTNSMYGRLSVVGTEGNRTLYENGLPIFTSPDIAAAEEAVHYALLEHPSPRSLLLIGGGVSGATAEAMRHPTLERIDYVELDPAIFALAGQYFPDEWEHIRHDPRVHLHNLDGRLYVKTTERRFDVIIVNLPDPQTAQLNRFYTVEFFREARVHLVEGGVLSFQLRASENYIGPALVDFLRCINRTLRDVFPEVVTIPGDTVHFFAATRPGILTADPQELIRRMRVRNLQTQYVREYFLPFRMSADRMRDLDEQIAPAARTPINHDFAPIAYYFNVALWSTQFNTGYQHLFQSASRVRFPELLYATAVLLGLVPVLLRWRSRRSGRARIATGIGVGLMGFTMMALEIFLLLGFQAIYGYVYHQLAIVIAGFMLGMALGCWWALSHDYTRVRSLALLQAAAAIAPLLLYGIFVGLEMMHGGATLGISATLLFPALAVLCGLMGGMQFPIAIRVFSADTDTTRRASALYALDLAGASVGAVLLSAWLIPVFGFFRSAVLVAAANLVATGLLGSAAREEARHS
jgi:spermidine synthase